VSRPSERHFEIVDRHHPEWHGQRFSQLWRARSEWRSSFPRARFWIKDRRTGADVTTTDPTTTTER
jgi:hypothetical protein